MKKKSIRLVLLFGAGGTVAAVNVWLAAVGLSFLTACHDGLQPLPQAACTRLQAYEAYPDSSFFQTITQMYVADSVLYAFDPSRGDVAVWNLRTNDFYTCGTLGQGPENVVQPSGFYVQDDTVYIMAGDFKLKGFYKGEFVRTLDVPASPGQRFFLAGDTVYVTSTRENSCYLKASKNWKRKDAMQGLTFCGHMFPIKEREDINGLFNRRHIINGGDTLYAVCRSYHVIEKYDLHTNELLEAYDLSELDFMRKNLSYMKEHEGGPTSAFVFLRDAYWSDGKLFILSADWSGVYGRNKVLVLQDSPTLTPLGIYRLPGNLYSCIAVEGDLIYAMNDEKCTIEICRLVPFDN